MAKYTIKEAPGFRRDRDRMVKRGYPDRKLREAVALLADGKQLDPTYRDHALAGKQAGSRECHIGGDWLLVYQIFENALILKLLRTGTHSDLFKK